MGIHIAYETIAKSQALYIAKSFAVTDYKLYTFIQSFKLKCRPAFQELTTVWQIYDYSYVKHVRKLPATVHSIEAIRLLLVEPQRQCFYLPSGETAGRQVTFAREEYRVEKLMNASDQQPPEQSQRTRYRITSNWILLFIQAKNPYRLLTLP